MTTKDPKLLVSEGATDFERRWLSAARAEEPPPELVARIEHALGIGAVVAAAQPTQTASAPVAAAKSGVSALRIAALSALGVGGAVGLVLFLTRPSAPPAVPAARPATEIALVEAAPAGGGAAIAPRETRTSEEAPVAAGTGALRDEIALIDGARAALAAGAPAQALSLLDRYRGRHPHGMLLPEALAMRIEAIDRGGDHARARTLARAFLADYPNSPLAQRIAHLADSEQK